MELVKLDLALAETRAELSDALSAASAEALSADEPGQAEALVSRLTGRVKRLETLRAAAIRAQGDAPPPSDGGDGERRERSALHARARVGRFLHAAARGKEVDGAEAEVRAAYLGDDAPPNMMPVSLLAGAAPSATTGEPEMRADAVTGVSDDSLTDGSRAQVLRRVFTRSIAGRLLVSMPSVPIGAATYPILTGGTTAQMRAPDARADATAATFTGFSLEPRRLSARYLFRLEDVYRFPQLEGVLRQDLEMAMSDAMDAQIVNGDGTAPNVAGFLTELTAPGNPSAATTWNQFLETFTGKVDGINAFMLDDVRAVVNSHIFSNSHSLFRVGATDNGPRESAYEYVRMRIGGMSVSSRLPGAASNVSTAILALTSYPGQNAVAPIWRGMELIRDPYSESATGRISITCHMLWNFKILRETGFALWKYRSA